MKTKNISNGCAHSKTYSLRDIYEMKYGISDFCSTCNEHLNFEPIKINREKSHPAHFVIPYGKHRGKILLDVAFSDEQYMRWGAKVLNDHVGEKFREFLKRETLYFP